MSVLLDILKADTDSKFCWSGMPDGPQQPKAVPQLLARNDHASVVVSAGALTQISTINLALLVYSEAVRPETRLVYLWLGAHCGSLGSLGTAGDYLRKAGEHAAVVAYLEGFAFGPAMWLAANCGLVFSHPCTQLGWFRCLSDEGVFDPAATAGICKDLGQLRPQVSVPAWARLSHACINGEQAEAMGMIGGIKPSIFAMTGIDPNGGIQ